MKVQITEESKQWMTVAEHEIAQTIIAELAEDEMPIEECAQMAARVASGKNDKFRIFGCHAEICGNRRISDWYGEGSGVLDVWIEFIAFNHYVGCYECGICLSDVHSITGDNANEIRSHMYINAFTRSGYSN